MSPSSPRFRSSPARAGGDAGTPITVGWPESPQAGAFRALATAVVRRLEDLAPLASTPQDRVQRSPSARVILPMFPLPDITFFPHTLLPLHIFEARYRALVADALARDRRLCIAQLEPGYEAAYAGRPSVRRVAGRERIVRWERLSTGRYNILVKGETRVRIEAEQPTRHAVPDRAVGRRLVGRRARRGPAESGPAFASVVPAWLPCS